MSTATPPFVAHCVELLAPLGAVRVRRMFGGWGFYVDEVFMAILADERLYLKTDVDSRAAFEHAGCQPFVYDGKTGAVALGYWSAPAEALDSPPGMAPWARLALQAALEARAARLERIKPAARPQPTPRAKTAATKARRRT